jgi:CrcB protein
LRPLGRFKGFEIRNFFIIGLGGFFGSILRYFISGLVHQLLQNSAFPYGSIFVNITGCFLIGLSNGLVDLRQMLTPELRLFLMIGLLGGFTTFSTFGYETLSLMRDGEFFSACANVFIQVFIGLLAVWLGYGITKYF